MKTPLPRRRPRDPKTGKLYRILGPAYKLTQPPQALKKAKLDNLALVPASLLLRGKKVARELPEGQSLVVLPLRGRPQHRIAEHVVEQMRARGQKVVTVPAERFGTIRTRAVGKCR